MTATAGLAVSAHGLVHIYRLDGNDVVALTAVDLEVASSQLVGLLGPSGAGKSTLLRLLAGIQRPSAGRLQVGPHNLATVSSTELDQLRAVDVGIMLQGAANNLLPYASATQNVQFAQAPGRRTGLRSPPGPLAILELVSLVDLSELRPAQMTPGQRQRLAVAVAMASLPGLLLCDEPTSQLDARFRDEVLDAIVTVNAQIGTTVIAVTHDPEVAARFDRTVTIRDGRIGSEGRGDEEFAVVGKDGTVQLPPHLRELIAPGTLLRVEDLLASSGFISLAPSDPTSTGE